MNKEFIVISGNKFTIEWFFDKQGNSPALEYFEELDENRQDKVLYLFKTMASVGQIHNIEKFRNEGDQIYAFKPSPDRFICFFVKGSKIIITNAFEKKTNKMPSREKEKALKYRLDYIEHVKERTYYD